MRCWLLLLSGICVQAAQIPLQDPGTSKTIDIEPDTFPVRPGLPTSIIEGDTSSNSAEENKWRCDIRSWVRAPDLQPSSIIPAETRLLANGSECSDILKWEVGLRFKERAIIKLKSKEIDSLPVRPEYPKYNASSRPQYDYNDIYYVGGVSISPWKEDYHTQLEAYNAAIKNQSLWEVRGSERIVFDIKQGLTLDPTNTSHIDEIRPFTVETPNTNFPPVDSKAPYGFIISANEEHILNTETMMEYYHSIHLKNGTILDIPAALTGFLPSVEPKRITKTSLNSDPWPVRVELTSPRLPLGSNETIDRDGIPSVSPYNPEGPECDHGNRAEFTLEINSNATQLVQGQNITLDITVTRTGNGTEYPAFLEMEMRTTRNITWAYNFLSTQEEYDAMFSASSNGNKRSRFPPLRTHMPSIQMLKKPTLAQLEDIREREGITGTSWSSSSNRKKSRKGQVRYDIEDEQEEGLEIYQFKVEVPVLDDHFPSFQATYETFQSTLQFQLMTMFTCEPIDKHAPLPQTPKEGESILDKDAELTLKRDKEWVEYKLPPKSDKKKLRNGRRLNHLGSMPLEINFKPTDSPQNTPLISYLDPDALAPIMSLPDFSEGKEFDKVGTPQPETGDLLRKTRYARRQHSGRGLQHAARLWESKENDQSEYISSIPYIAL